MKNKKQILKENDISILLKDYKEELKQIKHEMKIKQNIEDKRNYHIIWKIVNQKPKRGRKKGYIMPEYHKEKLRKAYENRLKQIQTKATEEK